LTGRTRLDIVKFMRCFTFAALCVGFASTAAEGQQVPARELLEFPIAIIAEAPALARQVAGGLWNPATIATLPGRRVHASAAAMNTPIAFGVSAQHVGATFVLKPSVYGAFSFTRAEVGDILRTGPDPSIDTLSSEIPYSTSIVSASAAWQFRTLTAGAAVRYRHGVADMERSGALSVDLGIVAQRVLGTPATVGLSTFLLSPSSRSREPLTVLAAAEVPVLTDSLWQAGLGYSFQHTESYGHEHYLFASGRWRSFDGRVGLAQHRGLVATTRRLRVGLGLQYARYLVGLAREESAAGLGGSYQFTLTATFK
jgi:hypothetical protein